jgi:hypothetical protein
LAHTESPLLGGKGNLKGKGNREFLAHLALQT